MTATPGPASTYAPYTPPTTDRPRPQHLGVAVGCTAAVGGLALLTGLAVLVTAFAFTGIVDSVGLLPIAGWISSFLLLVGLIPLVYGAVTLFAGLQLNRGTSGTYDLAVAMNVMSIVLAVFTLFAAGFGLLHGILSGVALWALYQPDVKAFFGR